MPEVPADFIPIKHHFIHGYKYDPTKRSMYLMFAKGGIYEYFNVENNIYEDFAKTETKGRYLNSIIKKYSFERLS